MDRSAAYFGENVPPRILSSLPSSYLRRAECYLGYRAEEEDLIIVAQADLDRVHVLAGGRERILGEEALEADPGPLEMRGDEIDEGEVALRAGRVEGDQPREELDVVQAAALQRSQAAAIRRWRGGAAP